MPPAAVRSPPFLGFAILKFVFNPVANCGYHQVDL